MISEEIRTIESCLTLHFRSSDRGSVRSLGTFELERANFIIILNVLDSL